MDRAESDYSGAQLKKKGRRVCALCIKNGGPVTANNASNHHAASATSPPTVPAASSASASAAAASAEAAAQAEAIASAPSNPHFPSQRPVLYTDNIAYYTYSSEKQLPLMSALIEADLSEPYSIFTYRYFLNFWPQLTFMAMLGSSCIGCIICRLTVDSHGHRRGYIAMLAVSPWYRQRHVGSHLVELVIAAMKREQADLIVLEAEQTNRGALALYEKLNFVRESRLVKYYLSGSDAYRLKLWLKPPPRDEHGNYAYAADNGEEE